MFGVDVDAVKNQKAAASKNPLGGASKNPLGASKPKTPAQTNLFGSSNKPQEVEKKEDENQVKSQVLEKQ